MYIWQNNNWPHFVWDKDRVGDLLLAVRHRQGLLLGMADALGFEVKSPVLLEAVTSDIVGSSEIEGIRLNTDEVRSSVAWQLGIAQGGVPSADRYVEGMVEVMMDALHTPNRQLTEKRLFGWHRALFPSVGRPARITVGAWRCSDAPMQVVSGRYGSERVHFEAPPSPMVPSMMQELLRWINQPQGPDDILMAAIAHLWFVSIHPFSDGNGRIARTITDMLLARADGGRPHLYSMSAHIAARRKAYYEVLEVTQKGTIDITEWLLWFLNGVDAAIARSQEVIGRTLRKVAFWEIHRQTAMNERQTAMVNRLWDGFEGKLTSGKWAKMCHCSTDTALRDIQDLVAKGILRHGTAGGRSTDYLLAGLI